ncbi:unnamed protein product [Pleuronectes platessa]|uniref:Uncharacterized protein n=1 Tax=Pleuronectes platessa TaxID=8262 RepID=A0A9N7UHZ3_PLEPL|nr:unnamed protein product [Pleuronectes platessa]
MMAKPSSLMDNQSHPLQDTITALGSSFCIRAGLVLWHRRRQTEEVRMKVSLLCLCVLVHVCLVHAGLFANDELQQTASSTKTKTSQSTDKDRVAIGLLLSLLVDASLPSVLELNIAFSSALQCLHEEIHD